MGITREALIELMAIFAMEEEKKTTGSYQGPLSMYIKSAEEFLKHRKL